MKGYKKWVTAGVALYIAGVLTGCGNANDTTGGMTPTNVTNQTAINTSTGITANTTTNAATNTSTGPQAATNISDSSPANQPGAIIGNTQIIHLVSPIPNQTVQAGSKIMVSGTVAKGFGHQTLQVQLLSGNVRPSKIIQIKKFQVGSDGKFSGQFGIPNNLPSSGTKMQVVFELLMKGGPEVSTTLIAK
ncbi:hypothetical protein [Alicyclobacillus ferrooxydans]|uniref:Bacterial spore germination immunoglobulin-like domain-containing protein n=1 Tax=Alicyclobacillus ferrooxydans TaxID=471514 RepID=A0A0P9CAR6_9BACL|nr:hypothetical protein [Alicyclobacillus ferrooxydans]KPV42530.1 hypothetical protein AN477_16940 [Alicyclobacillus ferrooxydans]